MIYLPVEEDALSARASVLISVPKKKFKRAVKRNLIKRRMREAYRIHKQELFDALANNRQRMLVAFLYLDKEILPFSDIEKAMQKALDVLRNPK